jgi:sulfur carrier protein ThiS
MVALKAVITQELENLNAEQLKQIADFIAFLKFRARYSTLAVDVNQIADLYKEFAEEDRRFAEEGLDEYAELLRQEDLK